VNIHQCTGLNCTKKCDFCVKTVILESVSAYVVVMSCRKRQELPQDGVDTNRSTSELQRDNMTTNCALIVG
jgi:hypothetical protein